ncbi:MAG: putA [Burkholderiales bacterium]|jgi:RHH-type proline utilization regulon transcriptional repressor/proline dehydrogenase/delta 1-pyrroline-5-carboxylate dehydrogenase|nr:putA [Burkholderiales bacterium]
MFNLDITKKNTLRQEITKHYRANEKQCVDRLLNMLTITAEDSVQVTNMAKRLISTVRNTRVKGRGIDAIMQEFKLSSEEGIALMCLAESMLRIPDKETQDKLIRDKIAKGNWSDHTKTDNIFVNATSWGLLITGKLVGSFASEKLSAVLLKVLAKGGEPLIRKSMTTAVKFMGNQFVMGETIEAALKASVAKEKKGYQFSYDMLGEAAMNDEDAMRYMQNYTDAIHAVGKANAMRGVYKGPGISVKLSAIHPRYQRSQYQRVINELYPRLKHLYLLAKEYQIGLFIDAEETDRLEISLDLLELLANDKDLASFAGIGFVIQAYQKRAPYVIDYVVDLAKRSKQRLQVRLVKGAYWDSEIKKAQVDGQEDYPVFTRKFYTDLSYLACAQKLLAHQDEIYPLFATHNARSLAFIYQMGKGKQFEYQCLYGMGETLYDNVVGEDKLNITCRVYAPVGTHETLLAYLVRRLLENGANSSFVHQVVDKDVPIDSLLISPIELSKKAEGTSNPNFKTPAHIYPDGRINSKGLDLTNDILLSELESKLNTYAAKTFTAYPLVANLANNDARVVTEVRNPANNDDIVGHVTKADVQDIDNAVLQAKRAFTSWREVSPQDRAKILLKVAGKMEEHYYELLSILVREAGKTLQNAIAEVREAVDFCRYYAKQVEVEFFNDTHKALGVFVCISPWNFPLAIFMGEISSALAAGNTVIAKPSYQTNLVAFYAVELFYDAGMPRDVLQLMPGSGSVIGNTLTKHKDIVGVIFTGSTEVARTINQNLAAKGDKSILIAETGGQNTMIVDSSSLPEQVVTDVITSGFDSAGQRCSALRVLYLQADIADKVLHMLKGAMDELLIGNPVNLSTDVGPVIDKPAQKVLLDHIDKMKPNARMFYQAKLSDECKNGIFVAPTLIEIGSIRELEREVFGPVVHVIRFAPGNLEKVVAEINSSGYGLTQGLHSRIESTAKMVYQNINAGNIYINRNMVGAVVGVQPFGGEGLSGTGPKAGGPLYLYRLVETTRHPNLNVSWRNYDFKALGNFKTKLKDLGFSKSEEEQLLKYADNARHESPLTMQVNLPGPTGELNFMFFVKRGTILCAAGSKEAYARQIMCALATDNIAILPEDEHSKYYARIMPKYIRVVANAFQDADISAVLVAKNYANYAQMAEVLAKRDGLLILNIHEVNDGKYNLHLLTTERTVSNNITATGGNVELMSINDNI